MHKKPRAKHAVHDNFEWYMYMQMARRFKDDPRVIFMIPDGPDCQFSLYNTSILATHGDQFRGGSGISGFFTPLMLGMMRKQKKHVGLDMPFHIMMCGHFHQYIHTNNLIVNGSMIGMNEWGSKMNFPHERPQQAAFIAHRHNGIILRTPILCDSYDLSNQKTKEQIAVSVMDRFIF